MSARLITLGGLRLIRNQQEVSLPVHSRARAALLVYLALQREVSREAVMSVFWPESDEEKARHALSQALYQLRQHLGNDWIVVNGDHLRVPSSLSVDAEEFVGLVEAGEYDAALKLYGGPFLAGADNLPDSKPFENWLDARRAQVQRLHRRVRRELIHARVANSDYPAALAVARAWVELDPQEDEAQHALIELLIATGAHAEAIQQYEEYERLLLADDLEALDETKALVQRARVELAATYDASTELRRRAPVRRGARRAQTAMAGLLIIGVLAVLAARAVFRAPDRTSLDSDLIAIFPFRVISADSAYDMLAEGMMDLLFTRLSIEESLRAADPRAVMSAWQEHRRSGNAVLDQEAAIALARELGAGQVLLGSVVNTLGRMQLSATLLDLRSGATRLASEEGDTANVLTLVDRLAAQLLGLASGEPDFRLATLTSASLPAVRAYLSGTSQYRRGQYRDAVASFAKAMETDSTFGLAAMGVLSAGIWSGTPPGLGPKARRLAWAARARLSGADSLRLLVLLRVDYPNRTTPGRQIDFLERSVALMPDDPMIWYELGDMLMHYGQFVGVEDWRRRATGAFERALQLDSMLLAPLNHLFYLAAETGDTAAVRRLSALWFARFPDTDGIVMWRWLTATLLRDSVALQAVRRNRFAEFDTPSLRSLVRWSMWLSDPSPDAELALAVLRDRAASVEERSRLIALERPLLHNRGQPAAAWRASRTFAATWPEPIRQAELRLDVVHALYWDGLANAGARAAQQLSASAELPLSSDSVTRAGQLQDICWVAQWRLAQGDTISTRSFIQKLRAATSRIDSESSVDQARICATVLDALWAAAAHRAYDATLLRLDSLVMHLAYVDRGLIPAVFLAGNLVSARLHRLRGDYASGLAAARRRLSSADAALHLSSFLREEAPLAALAGDTASAIRAYQHYLTLRSHPEPVLRPRTDSVRAEFNQLLSALRQRS